MHVVPHNILHTKPPKRSRIMAKVRLEKEIDQQGVYRLALNIFLLCNIFTHEKT